MATPRKPKARKPATRRRGGTLSRVGSVNAPTQKRKTRSGSPAKRKTAAEKAKDKKAREKRERSMSPKEKKDRAARNKVTAERRKGNNTGPVADHGQHPDRHQREAPRGQPPRSECEKRSECRLPGKGLVEVVDRYPHVAALPRRRTRCKHHAQGPIQPLHHAPETLDGLRKATGSVRNGYFHPPEELEDQWQRPCPQG